MYVQVTAGNGMGGDFLLESPTNEIRSGTALIPILDRSAPDLDIGGLLIREIYGWTKEEENHAAEHGHWWNTLHVLEIDREQEWADLDKQQWWLPVKYAWWHDAGGPSGIATTRNIFILGNNGKTIARVR